MAILLYMVNSQSLQYVCSTDLMGRRGNFMECNTDSMRKRTYSGSGMKSKGLPAKRRRREPFRGPPMARPTPPPLFAAANNNPNEKKFIDNLLTNTPPAGTSTFDTADLLNGVASGTTAVTRIGRKIRMKSILVRAEARMNSLSTGGADIRIVIVYDKQANAALAVDTDVFAQDEFLSPNNLSNKDRFVTIMDKYLHIDTQNFQCSAIWYKKIDLETMFNANTTGGITDITSGSVLMFVAQSGGIATNVPQVRTYSRIRFDD